MASLQMWNANVINVIIDLKMNENYDKKKSRKNGENILVKCLRQNINCAPFFLFFRWWFHRFVNFRRKSFQCFWLLVTVYLSICGNTHTIWSFPRIFFHSFACSLLFTFIFVLSRKCNFNLNKIELKTEINCGQPKWLGSHFACVVCEFWSTRHSIPHV